jgi:hypothetical protein
VPSEPTERDELLHATKWQRLRYLKAHGYDIIDRSPAAATVVGSITPLLGDNRYRTVQLRDLRFSVMKQELKLSEPGRRERTVARMLP